MKQVLQFVLGLAKKMAKFMGRSIKIRPDNVLLVINMGLSVPVRRRKPIVNCDFFRWG